jgi:hypothetical protein
MSTHLDYWHPRMIERFSARGRAGIGEFKAFIREHVSTAALEERALTLAGLPAGEIDEGLAVACCELADELVRVGMPAHLRAGVIIAAADLIRLRVLEFQSQGAGHA